MKVVCKRTGTNRAVLGAGAVFPAAELVAFVSVAEVTRTIESRHRGKTCAKANKSANGKGF